MKSILIAGLASTALGWTPAQAQSVTYWPAPAAADQTAGNYYFPMGTQIALRTRTQLSTKENKAGDRIYLEVAESLAFRGQVVVPAGSVAVGEVAAMQRNGHFGRKGKLNIRLLYIDTPTGPVRLSGQANDEGTSGTAASVATILFVSPLGFLIHGTSAQLPPDTVVQAYLAEDMRFALRSPAQVASTPARPDGASGMVALAEPRELPATFDPRVFGGGTPARQ